MGCRRQALHRLRRLVGTGDPRPCASGRREGRAGNRCERIVVRRADRDRDRACRDALPTPAFARARAPGVVGHRGDDVGAAPRARLHGAIEDREVRRLLSRPRRQPAGEGGFGRADLRPAVVGRRAAGDRERDDRAALQRPRRGRCRVPQRRHRDRLRHRRAGRRQHEPDRPRARISAKACARCATATAPC